MAKYPSTLLPQDNTPQENQKAVLDLLDKTNKVHDDATSGINAAKAELQKQIDAITQTRSAIVVCRGNPATIANNVIQYTEIIDTNNCYDSGVFTYPSDGVAFISISFYNGGGSANATMYMAKNTTLQHTAIQYASQITVSGFGGGSVAIEGVVGDTIYANVASNIPASTQTSLGIQFIAS